MYGISGVSKVMRLQGKRKKTKTKTKTATTRTTTPPKTKTKTTTLEGVISRVAKELNKVLMNKWLH